MKRIKAFAAWLTLALLVSSAVYYKYVEIQASGISGRADTQEKVIKSHICRSPMQCPYLRQRNFWRRRKGQRCSLYGMAAGES